MPEAMNVLADPQFGLVRILRPYFGFESDYATEPVSRPILVSQVLQGPGGEPRDSLALQSQPGYDPDLVRGLTMPVGARVILKFPKIIAGGDGPTPERYIWRLIWRLRNVHDYRVGRLPYHYPKQGAGVPDTSGGGSDARVVIPAADHTVIYSEVPEPSGATATVSANARTEDYTFGGTNQARPFVPATGGPVEGVIQQGILDPGSPIFGDDAVLPTYQWKELQAVGDDLVIEVYREAGALNPNWDFGGGGDDEQLAIFLGGGSGQQFPDVGVYVMVGSSP